MVSSAITLGRTGSVAVVYGYSYALVAIAVGLFGTVFPSSFGSALFWTGRAGQWLGVYMLMAAMRAAATRISSGLVHS
jgi:hypothetical protein